MEQTDGYKLIRQIGSGIAGPVWMADGPSGRVAMRKFTSPAPQGSEEWIADRAHFLQAAKQSLAFRHPRVVPVLDVVDDPDDVWVASEFVEDETLESVLKRERLSIAQAGQILRGIGPILDQAHRSGIVHGDLKPSNIFLGPKNQIRLADFAISPRARRSPRPEVNSGWVHPYLTPEHLIAPGMIGPRTDVYALAAIAWLMYTGKAPFSSGGDVKAAILRGQLDLPSTVNSAIAGGVETALRKAMSRDPGQRFADCAEFVGAMDVGTRSAAPVPVAAAAAASGGSSPTLIYAGIGSLVVALIVAAFLMLHGPRKAADKKAEVATPVAATGSTIATTSAPVTPVSETNSTKRPLVPATKSARQTPEIVRTDEKRHPFEAPPGPPPVSHTPGGQNSVTPPPVISPRPNPPVTPPHPTVEPGFRAQDTVTIPTGDEPKGYSIKVYSRKPGDPKHLIGKGISFKYLDPDLGEMGLGDLMAMILLNGPPPAKGRKLSIAWVVDGQIMDGHLVNPNTITTFGSEPIRGTYQLVLRLDTDPVADYTFRITP